MQVKSIKLFTLALMVIVPLLVITGCGKSGSRFANIAPVIRITSYEGYDPADPILANYADSLFLFQQKIYWHATDEDGVINGFAYRVLNDQGAPIATPGNHYVDMDGTITPQNVIDRFGTGWVMHYMPNANQDIPLDDPEARRTIWSSQKYAVINFPAADANGDPLNILSKFEVIAVDNRGEITQEAAYRWFTATSARPRCMITTTKGNPSGGQVGSGIRLSFSMKDYDPFIPETPFKYEFKMAKINPTTNAVLPGSETGWYDSVTPQDPKINEFLLTRYTNPSLSYDFENGNMVSKTIIYTRVYDLAGVVSVVDTSAILTCAVKPGFRPETMIYPQKVYALGDNHFIDYADESTPEILPFSIVAGAQRFATPFFNDLDTMNTAINSHNIKVWIRWGWKGEYGQITSAGSTIYTNNPYDKKVDTVLDRDTNLNYFSEITNFDLRLDGDYYHFGPYANSIVTDAADGKRWLRIPTNSVLGQTVVLTQLPSGSHTFEVRCVDLQGEVDPIPVSFTFVLHDLIPAADRSGVLIVDDDRHNAQTSPEAIVNQKYENMFSDFGGTVAFIKRTNTQETGDTNGDIRYRHLASTDLQHYKLVIYHSDNPSESGNLKNENDGLVMYMHTGGNVLISHTSKLASVLDSFVIGSQRTFLSNFGIPYISQPAQFLSDALQTRAFFQTAMGEEGYPDVQLQWGDPASFNPLVNNLQGLSTITYFNSHTATPIYKMGIKPVGYTPAGPTQEQYDMFMDTQGNPTKAIGLRKINTNNRCFLFGFPLSYMQDADTKAMMNVILQELGMM